MAGRQEHAADVGLAGDHMIAPYDVGKDVLVAKAILQRHHDRVRADERLCGLHRLAGVERLHQHDHEIDDTDVTTVGRGLDLDDALAVAGRMRRPLAFIAST